MSTQTRDLDKEIQRVEELRAEYVRRVDAADQLLQALKEQKQGLEGERQALAVLEQPIPTVQLLTTSERSSWTQQRVKVQGKPNTQLYEEIILDHGRPMHMSDILKEAFNRGLVLQGDREPIVQMRGALANCKRLYNVGGNIWWITDRPVPEEHTKTNGHDRPVGVSALPLTALPNSPAPPSTLN